MDRFSSMGMPSRRLVRVPSALVALRLVLGPLLIANALLHGRGIIVAIAMSAAFLSDIFDGKLARGLHVDTARLRRADSLADVAFYACVAVAIGITAPGVWLRWWPVPVGFAFAEVVLQAVHLWRFRDLAAVHAYATKAWGIVLFVTATLALLDVRSVAMAWAVVATGVYAYAETFAIVLFSGEMPVDIRSFASLGKHPPCPATPPCRSRHRKKLAAI